VKPLCAKDWEIIADNLSKAGWSWGCVAARDREGRAIWIVDAHGYGKRFIVRADDPLSELKWEIVPGRALGATIPRARGQRPSTRAARSTPRRGNG
jgi:hypothetical protein